jgi:ParB family transcriptional regulator, chromosome partitioning protein
MARKRLTPANPEYLAGGTGAPETKSLFRLNTNPPPNPPIAQVAGESAASSALRELVTDMEKARAEGRIVLRLALDQIAAEHLVRDRMQTDKEEMQSLIRSLRSHGQRTPVEVTETGGDPAYGLISGWRRILALQRLYAETGEDRYNSVLALLRRPADAADAYVAMVEENEIRADLSYFERARIAAEATKRGVFETEKKALLTLFASASRPKRSRIRSFIELYHALNGFLRFPSYIPERLGLALVEALRNDETVLRRLRQGLRRTDVQTVAEEQALLARLMKPVVGNPVEGGKADVPHAEHRKQELRPGVFLTRRTRASRLLLEISGPDVDEVLAERIAQVLKGEA